MTWQYGDISLMMKLTDAEDNPLTETVTIHSIPYQDSIHPYPLKFDPPLIGYATGESNGFAHHWEKLTYAFDLPDPSDFPQLPLEPEDRDILQRFVSVCHDLAGYSVINDEAALRLSSTGGGNWSVKADLPSREAFGGTSVALRQLHSNQEPASFDKVEGRLFKATRLLDQHVQSRLRSIMSQWVDARGQLMNHTLPTVVCQKLSGAPPGHPISFRDVNPEDLLLTFNYGDTIHWGDRRERLVELTADPYYEAYYKDAVVISIAGLAHLYFGFSTLARRALGEYT